MADLAVFGEKDYQQLTVIRQLVKARELEVDVIGGEVIREESGLAMSSRNIYLSEVEHKIASLLYHNLRLVSEKVREGCSVETAISQAKDLLLQGGFNHVDYIEIRDARTFGLWHGRLDVPARILGAVRISGVRLIDNIPL